MLMEENIKCYIEDKQISANHGFLRSLPMISSLFEPVYTYHASKWYHKYMQKHGSFDNMFSHTWVHLDEIEKCRNIDSFSIILDRDAIDHLETKTPKMLDDIFNSILSIGVQQIILAIDNTHEFRISKRRVRPISSIVRVTPYDVMYNNWVRDVEKLQSTISCRSKNIILKAYGVYEQVRATLEKNSIKTKKYNTYEDILGVDMPLIVVDILYRIMQKIDEPDPSTHIKVSDVERYLTPWFENRKELIALRNRCCECIDDLPNFLWKDRLSLNKKIESEMRSFCSNDDKVLGYQRVKRVVDGCVI